MIVRAAAFLILVVAGTPLSAAFLVGQQSRNITPCPADLTGCPNDAIKLPNTPTMTRDAEGTLPFDAIHSPLLVRALAVKQGTTAVVVIALDVGGFHSEFADAVRARIRQSSAGAAMSDEQIVISATHTHSAPTLRSWCPGARCGLAAPVDAAWRNEVEVRAAAAAVAALETTAPATLWYGSGLSQIAAYRRGDGYQPTPAPYPQPLTLLEARDANGAPIALLFSTACHPVDMMGTTQISSDFVGAARAHVENSGVPFAMFLQGFAGDLDPAPIASATGAPDAAEKHGKQLADAVSGVRATLSPVRGVIRASVTDTQLRTRPISADPATPLPLRGQTVTIGAGATSWTLAALSHEVVSGFYPRVRNAFPNPDRVTAIGYASMVDSYLPTERIQQVDYADGGYEGGTSFNTYRQPEQRPAWTDGEVLRVVAPARTPAALALSGASYVEVPGSVAGSPLDLTGPMTVEAWIRTDASGIQQGIVERYNTYGPTTYDGGYALRLHAGGHAQFYTIRNGHVADWVTSALPLTVGAWHHVAGVYDGTNLRLFVDGALSGEKVASIAPSSGSASLKIGASGDYGSNTFQGRIDAVRVSGEAVYASPFLPPLRFTATPATAGLWTFDGSTATDLSGHGHDGVLHGSAAQFSAEVPPVTTAALRVSRHTSYAEVADAPSLDVTGALTVEAFVRTTAPGRQQGIIERYRSLPGGVIDGGYGLRINAAGKPVFFVVRNGLSSYAAVTSAQVVEVGRTHHLAGVYDGTTLHVFVDGVLTGSAAATVAPAAGTGALKIGQRDDGEYGLAGEITQARLSSAALYGGAFAVPQQLTAGSATAALWRFDLGSPRDLSGNGNHATPFAGASVERRSVDDAPSANVVARFDGSSHLEAPSTATTNITGPYTIEAWIKTNVANRQQGIVERYSATGGGYQLRLMSDGTIDFANIRDAWTFVDVRSTTVIAPGVWHHVAGVFDGSKLELYIDGVPNGSVPTTLAPAAGTATVKIGARGDDGTFQFDGMIDDVRISSGAAYAGAFIPQRQLPRTTATIGLWKFDDSSSLDDSGWGNDAFPVRACTFTAGR